MGDSARSSLGTCFKQEKSTVGWEEARWSGRLVRRWFLGSIVGKSQAGLRVSRVTARLIGQRVVEEVGGGNRQS